jgi:glycerol-3-phosphate dehydrogenase
MYCQSFPDRLLRLKKEGKSTKEVSGAIKLLCLKLLITITGGKWTTYRKIAEDIIDKAITVRNLPKRECKTENISIHGNIKTSMLIVKPSVYIRNRHS